MNAENTKSEDLCYRAGLDVSKWGALLALLTRGWSGLIVYFLEAINKWLSNMDAALLKKISTIVTSIAQALKILMNTFLPEKYTPAATLTVSALEELVKSIEDGEFTKQELEGSMAKIEACVDEWKKLSKSKESEAVKAACASLALLAVVGCSTTGPQPSRAQVQHNEFSKCMIVFGASSAEINQERGSIHAESGSKSYMVPEMCTQTMQNDGSETVSPTSTATTDVKPQTDLTYGITGTGSTDPLTLLAGRLINLIPTGSGTQQSSSASASGTCTDGSCSDGSCTDGSCSPCADGSCNL